MKKKWIILFLIAFVLLFMFVGNDDSVLDMNLAAAATRSANTPDTMYSLVEAVRQQQDEDRALEGSLMTHDQIANSNASVLDIIYTLLKEEGLNDIAVAGILGNFHEESGFDPAVVQTSNGVGYGLAQWSFPTRKQGMLEYLQANGFPQITDDVINNAMHEQYNTSQWKSILGNGYSEQALTVREIEFLIKEMNEPEFQSGWTNTCGGYDTFRNADTVENAALWFHTVMEGSSDTVAEIQERVDAGEVKYEEIQNGTIKSLQIVASNPSSTGILRTIELAEQMCDDDTYGYNDPWPDHGSGKLDCSGFVSYCITCTVDPEMGRQSTSSMDAYFASKPGKWKEVTDEVNRSNGERMQKGDVLVIVGHTEFYYESGKTIGSHGNYSGSSGDISGNEICPANYGNGWTTARVWRYIGN